MNPIAHWQPRREPVNALDEVFPGSILYRPSAEIELALDIDNERKVIARWSLGYWAWLEEGLTWASGIAPGGVAVDTSRLEAILRGPRYIIKVTA